MRAVCITIIVCTFLICIAAATVVDTMAHLMVQQAPQLNQEPVATPTPGVDL